MALKFILANGLPLVGAIAGEEYFVRSALPILYNPSSLVPFLPRAYSGVLFVNVVSSTFAMFTLGGKVGAARKEFTEKARKDGDTDAEARFSYPKMYAEGFSQHAKLFNCVQRGHQHALESYTSFVLLSLIAGIKYPVTAMVGGILWHVARFSWAAGYATGDPKNRYANFFGMGIWTSILIELIGAVGTIIAIAQ
jgi:glutathione S-transferase